MNMSLSKENIEEQILLFVDGELDAVSEQQLMSYLDKNREYQSMLDHYLMSKVDAEESIIFPDKKSLFRQEENVTSFFAKLKIFRWAAVIALTLAAASIFLFNQNKREINYSAIAKYYEVKKIAPEIITRDTGISKVIVGKRHKEAKHKWPAKSVKREQLREKNKIGKVVVRKDLEVTPITFKGQPTLKVEPMIVAVLAKNTSYSYHTEEASNKLPSWSPVNDENLVGVVELIEQVQSLREKIQQRAKMLRNTTVVIQLGNKKIELGERKD